MARSASTTIKGITIEIGGNATKLLKSLEDVNKKSRDVQSELKGINSLLKFDPKNTELLKQKYTALNEAIDNTKAKLKKLQDAEENVQKQVQEGKISQEQYRDFQREIIATEQDLQKLKKQMKSFGSVTKQQLQNVANDFKNAGNKMQEVSQKLSKFSIAAGAGLLGMAKTAIDFEDAFTGVEKTVDGTTEQLANLKQGIRDMAKEIPASTTEIAGVAEAAGQLGIKTDDVLEFTRVMIDLGNSTNMSADTAASSLAKFSNIMGTTSDNYKRLGSTIVDLGNNFATTEADITSMAMRIAGAGKTIGLSEANVLSLATALSSVGIEAEMGGSAISKLMVNMSKSVEQADGHLKDFAKIAGMSAKDFQKAFKEDAAGALAEFIKGLSNTERYGASTLQMIGDLGMNEVRLRDTMLRAANASDVFTDALSLGNKAWQDNNALTNEANKRYSTTKSQMQISINKIKDLSISLGSKLLPVAQKGLTLLNKLVDGFSNMSDETQTTILKLAGLTAVATPVLSTTGKITSGVGKVFDIMGKLAGASDNASGKLSGFSSILSKMSSPSGIILTAVGVLGTLAGAFLLASDKTKKYSEEAKKSLEETKKANQEHKNFIKTIEEGEKKRKETIENTEKECGTVDILYQKLVELEGVENKTNAQKELMAQLVNELNEKMPDLNLHYDKEKDKLNKTTEAIKDQIEAEKDLLRAKVARSQLSDIMGNIVNTDFQLMENEKTEEDAKNAYEKKKKELEELEYQLEHGDNRGTRGELLEKIKDARGEVNDLREKYNTAKSNTQETRNKQNKLQEEYNFKENYANDYFNRGDLGSAFAELKAKAKKAGIEISDNLSKGMKEGSIVIPETVEGLKKLITFEEKLKTVSLQGEKIPLMLSNAIASGKVSVEQAVKEMQAIVDFKNAEDKSQISGVVIPEKLRDGILNGELTVTEAVKRANDWIKFEKANKEATDKGHKIPEHLKNGILDGKLSVTEANNQMNAWIKFEDAVKDAKSKGIIISDELTKNIQDGKVKVETATESINNAIKQHLPTRQMGVDSGGNLVEGVKVGIDNKKNSLFSVMGNLALNAIKTFNKKAGIASPSKETQKSAEFLLEGLNVGVSKNKSKVFKNISNFGSDVLKSLNTELNDTNAINTEFNGTRNLMMNVMAKTNPNINSSTTEEIKTLTTLMDKYMPEVIEQLKQGKNVYLDSKKVGQSIAPEVNNQLGIISSKTQRGY